jgi:acetyl-CoA synthetase
MGTWPGVEIVLLDPITGELAGRGRDLPADRARATLNLMAGYLGEPERTGRAIHDGHFHTSDVAVRDADGFLTFIGCAPTM